MENLVGRKVKCVTNGYCNFYLHQYYIIFNESETMYVVQDKFGECKDFPKHKFKYYFELLPNEHQFKQGDKVLVSYNEIDWHETEFVCYYKDYYYTINGRAKNIKPYEEEIKVGDWVFLNDEKGVCKITDKHDLKEVNNKFTLVKDQQLIELLNKEI